MTKKQPEPKKKPASSPKNPKSKQLSGEKESDPKAQYDNKDES